MSFRIEQSPPSSNVCTDTGYEVSNPAARPSAQGPVLEQVEQAAYLMQWTQAAAESHAGLDKDGYAAMTLRGLDPTPPDTSRPTEFVDYTSTLKGVSAQAAFDDFTANPQRWFGAAGITLHPPPERLEDGARLFLQEPGVTPPVWAPIEVHVDARAKTVRITTLDGHPLKGVNQFSFDDGPSGDCQLRQSSAFQMSSLASSGGAALMRNVAQDPIERQHDIWKAVHADVADHAGRK